MYELKRLKNYSSSKVLNLSRFQQLENQLFNIASGLDKLSETNPGAVAFVESTKSGPKITTYKELHYLMASKSNFLKKSGIGKLDVVLVLQPQSIELFVSILAILKLGATVMFADPSMNRKSLEYSISQVAPRAAILTLKSMVLTSLLKSVRSIPIKMIDESWLSHWGVEQNSLELDSLNTEPVKKSQVALITFTSGSSGRPKAIARSHGFLKTQLDILANELEIKKDQIELTSLPMFVLANIASGATTVLSNTNLSSPAKAKGKQLCEEITQSGSTSLLGSPSLINNIVTKAISSKIQLPQIKKVLTGGGTVSLSLLTKIATVCPNARIVTVYGSSEAEPICHQNFNQTKPEDKVVTQSGGGILVGKPVDSISLRVLELQSHPEFSQTISSHIQKLHGNSSIIIGEILVTGDHVVKRYYNNIGDPSNKVIIDGNIWHKTNDIGYLDNSGRLWLTGAKPKDEIDTTYSFCVEQAASKFINYDQTAFYLSKNKGTLFVQKNKDLTEKDKLQLLNSLAWAGINDIQVVNNLPVDRRHNTKVLYSKLKQRVRL